MADNFAQTVKQQADILKIIGDYVRLKKAGAQNYSGLCPFHSEKTPSFSVNATRQFYYCFGCHETGDVFTFIQKIENVSFPEAVKTVAVKCGIPLPKREFSSPQEAAESRQRTKLIELHELATAWFEEQLRSPEGALAREYLTGRGLADEGISKFRIGYAPESFHALRDRLQSVADTDTLRASGLFSFKPQEGGTPGPLYSRFRKRITFPIANESGRIIAFTARALESGDKAGPKYLNSPETSLYTKGNVLFNLDKARQPIREANFAVLVEGQMDCISAYLAGITNVLATSGTAFTEAQVRLLTRYTTRVIANFDPDTAGANAAEKSIALLTEEGFEVKVVALEGGLDPDRYIRERGAKEYAAALRAARRHQDYLIDRACQLFPPRTSEAKLKAMNFLLPHVRRIPQLLLRDEFVRSIAERLAIDSAILREELKRAASQRTVEVANDEAHLQAHIKERRLEFSVEEATLLKLTGLERDLFQILSDPNNDQRKHFIAIIERNPGLLNGFRTEAILRIAVEHDIDVADPAISEEDKAIIAAIWNKHRRKAHSLLPTSELERLLLERRRKELRTEIINAERSGDFAGSLRLMAEADAIEKNLRGLS
jgi:DNA primase